MSILLNLTDYENPSSLGSWLRRRRRHHLEGLIDAIYVQRGRVRILDLGGRRQYWKMFDNQFLKSRKVHVTLLNYGGDAQTIAPTDQGFSATLGDACDLGRFGAGSFDLTHSNSTIEHVGNWERMEAFAAECRRVSDAYFLQTPYFWFPIEPHFLVPLFHWLPEDVRAKLLMRAKLGHHGPAANMSEAMREINSAKLLDRAQLRYLLPDATIKFEWLGPLPKSLIAIRNPT
jgi:hypothetical protein